MAEAYVVDALRSPTGRRNGGLSHVHGADLGAHVIASIVARNAIPGERYEANGGLRGRTPSANTNGVGCQRKRLLSKYSFL